MIFDNSPTNGHPTTALEYKMEMKRIMELVTANGLNGLNQDEMRMLKQCCDSGYIEGVKTVEMISGRIAAEIRYTPALTLAGMEFCDALTRDENEPQKNQENADPKKEMVDSLKKLAKRIWVIFLAIAAIVGFWVDWPAFFEIIASWFHSH